MKKQTPIDNSINIGRFINHAKSHLTESKNLLAEIENDLLDIAFNKRFSIEEKNT